MSKREVAEKFFTSLEGVLYGKSKFSSVVNDDRCIIFVFQFPSQPGDEPGQERSLRYLLTYREQSDNWIIALSQPLGYGIRQRREVAAALAKAKSRNDFQEHVSDDESVDGVVLNLHGDLSEKPFDVEELGRDAALAILVSRVVSLAQEFFKAQELIYKEIGPPADTRRH